MKILMDELVNKNNRYGKKEEFFMSYADDITGIFTNPKGAVESIKALEIFTEISGIKLHMKKKQK